MKKLVIAAFTAMAFCTAVSAQQICAHRGFWKSKEAMGAENSLASLNAAGRIGVEASEFDVHITSDDVIIVNHDDAIAGLEIHDNAYNGFARMYLPNGEHPATLGAYLAEAEKYPELLLVFEIKKQKTRERSNLLQDMAITMLRAHGLLEPSRVIFISFDYEACKRIASLLPGFTVQYLQGDKSPAEVFADGINGIDYHFSFYRRNPQWVEEAHALGMSVNVYTVDNEQDIQDMIDLGVDCITTNEPLKVRALIEKNRR